MRLVNVTRGRLSSRGVVSNITIVANDDPYGVFEFEPSILAVREATRNITLHVVRHQGTLGSVRVNYTSRISHVWRTGDNRASDKEDFIHVDGFLEFVPNQTLETFMIQILDDVKPEENETVVVNLTSALLLTNQHSGTISYYGRTWKLFLQAVVTFLFKEEGLLFLELALRG